MLAGASTFAWTHSASSAEPEQASLPIQLAQAGAQAPAAAEPGGFEEVIVTARKREEQVQTVPIAITAFSQEMLENKGIETIQDLRFAAPSLYIATDTFRKGLPIPASTTKARE